MILRVRSRRNAVPAFTTAILTAATAAVVALSGCSGGNLARPGTTPTTPIENPSTPVATSRVHIVIHWLARGDTRSGRSGRNVVDVYADALSVQVRLKNARPDGTDAVFTIDRDPSRADAYVQEYTTPDAVKTGATTLTVAFFTQPQAAGQPIATAVREITIDAQGQGVPDLLLGEIAVEISPSAVTLRNGTTQAFSASGDVLWSVRGSGTITADGVYTAPDVAASDTVVATSVADPSRTAEAAVTVITTQVAINPSSVTLPIGASQRFTASVTNPASGDTRVVWAVEEGASGGTITAEGDYTAPAVPGTYHVTATSASDPARGARAEVIVQAGSLTTIIR